MTRRRRPGFTRGSRRCGAAAFAASFGRKPYGAATAAHGSPGDRPPAVPAVSRCRARQHHGQADSLAPECAGAVKMSQRPGPERRALSGLAPPASTVLRIPLRGTRLRRAVDPGDLCQPSGPDGEGQARGQARTARGEPLQFHNCTRYAHFMRKQPPPDEESLRLTRRSDHHISRSGRPHDAKLRIHCYRRFSTAGLRIFSEVSGIPLIASLMPVLGLDRTFIGLPNELLLTMSSLGLLVNGHLFVTATPNCGDRKSNHRASKYQA